MAMLLRLWTVFVCSVAGSKEGVCSGIECAVQGDALLQSATLKVHGVHREAEAHYDPVGDYDFEAEEDLDDDGNSTVGAVLLENSYCQKWCRPNTYSWHAKCKWKSCKFCTSCHSDCKPWCLLTPRSSAEKCSWPNCEKCDFCNAAPTPRPTPRPTPPTPRPTPRPAEWETFDSDTCKPWCKNIESQCKWKGCSTCKSCCPSKCNADERPWTTKCKLDECGACCYKMNKHCHAGFGEHRWKHKKQHWEELTSEEECRRASTYLTGKAKQKFRVMSNTDYYPGCIRANDQKQGGQVRWNTADPFRITNPNDATLPVCWKFHGLRTEPENPWAHFNQNVRR